MSTRFRLAVLSLVVVTAAACSDDGGTFGIGGESSTTSATTATTGGGDAPIGTTGTTSASGDSSTTSSTLGDTTTTTTAEPAGPRRPAAIMEGLATFDSYRWQMTMSTIGPSAEESNDVAILLVADKPADARFTRITSIQTGPDFDEPAESVSEVTQVGTETCTFDGETYTYEEMTAQQREILDVSLGLFDLQVIPGADAELVGEEEVAGIRAYHYRYALPGLGQDSGAVVAENVVNYWISTEGDVLLRYRMDVETRSGPTTDPAAEVFRIEVGAQLIWANQPGDITFPQGCADQRGS